MKYSVYGEVAFWSATAIAEKRSIFNLWLNDNQTVKLKVRVEYTSVVEFQISLA